MAYLYSHLYNYNYLCEVMELHTHAHSHTLYRPILIPTRKGRVVSVNQGRMAGTRVWVVNPNRGEGETLYKLETIVSIEEENTSGQRGELVNPLYTAIDK